jgi:hypothetical protein
MTKKRQTLREYRRIKELDASATDGGVLTNELLLSLYGALAGLNAMPVEVLEGTRDEARCRYAREIIRRGLDTGCSCEHCVAIRRDAQLADLDGGI